MTHTVGQAATDSQQTEATRPSSPPTARATAIIELLADPGTGPLTVAEIVRAVGVSRATAHAILGELNSRGWVVRHPIDGTYGIGPGFLVVARSAQDADHLGHWAAAAVHRLVDELRMPCFLARRLSADTITVVDYATPIGIERVGSDTGRGSEPWMEAGRRIRLRPPISREFITWASADVRAAWIEQAPASARTRLTMVLDAIRERGYSIERMTDDHAAMIDALSSLDTVSDRLRTRVGDLLTELTIVDYLPDELTGDVAAVTVGAPVFDAAGEMVAAVVACPNRTLPAAELMAVGDAARSAAESVTAQLAAVP
ncbi:IclR family transcriptional regulator [Gordonia soli]|uniref:Putative IclR family transcriptional regulator n=1 Tax=Gordonia soli NBRC 108243 TaxID=1223545 RepID=M0QIS0_9ACTN|nr:helix-turn-helix domain-containing protein [Gordonia soli]GAC68438.1 putative IclR family transcriptional regulator [Gordonia soli NBRC 108243]